MRKILFGALVLVLLVGLVAPALGAIGIWKAQNPNETGVPTTGTSTFTSGQVTFGWTENTTRNITDAYNISVYTAGGAVSSWANYTNATRNYAITSGTGTYYIGVWGYNASGDDGNWSTHPLNITGYIIDPRGATPSVPPAVVVPIGILGSIVLFVVLRKRHR
jgi:hypothetical protein